MYLEIEELPRISRKNWKSNRNLLFRICQKSALFQKKSALFSCESALLQKQSALKQRFSALIFSSKNFRCSELYSDFQVMNTANLEMKRFWIRADQRWLSDTSTQVCLCRGKLSLGPTLGLSKLSKTFLNVKLHIHFSCKRVIYTIHGIINMQNVGSWIWKKVFLLRKIILNCLKVWKFHLR